MKIYGFDDKLNKEIYLPQTNYLVKVPKQFYLFTLSWACTDYDGSPCMIPCGIFKSWDKALEHAKENICIVYGKEFELREVYNEYNSGDTTVFEVVFYKNRGYFSRSFRLYINRQEVNFSEDDTFIDEVGIYYLKNNKKVKYFDDVYGSSKYQEHIKSKGGVSNYYNYKGD